MHVADFLMLSKQNVVNLIDGADGIINFLEVEDMINIGRVLRTFGEGSQARLRSASITDNVPESGNPWRAVEAIDGSSVVIQFLNMANNQNLEHHIAATFRSTVSIVEMEIVGSTGSLGSVSKSLYKLFFSANFANFVPSPTKSSAASTVLLSTGGSEMIVSDSRLAEISDITVSAQRTTLENAIDRFSSHDHCLRLEFLCFRGVMLEPRAFALNLLMQRVSSLSRMAQLFR